MIGYFGYDSLSRLNDNNSEFPDIAVGFYDWSIVVNHDKKKSHIVFKKEKSIDLSSKGSLLNKFW